MGSPGRPTDAYLERHKKQLIELRPAVPPKLGPGHRVLILMVKAVIFPIVWLYKILVGWWLDPLSSRRDEIKLKQTVRQDLAFLFEKSNAKFVLNDRKVKCGPVVILECRQLRFETSWSRGDHFLRVAPLHAPLDWESVPEVLMAIKVKAPINSKSDLPQLPIWSGLAGLARLMEVDLIRIEEALSPSHHRETVALLERMEEIERRDFIERWDRNARFYREHPEAASAWNKKEKIQTLGLKDYSEE